MRTYCVMQPTYLPWMGYFDLIRNADCFVLLDHVAFSKQSWQQRNRIKGPNGLFWLTVPVESKGRLGQLISEVRIAAKQTFAPKHLKSIALNYRNASRYEEIFPALEQIYLRAEAHLSLCELNVDLIRLCSGLLGLEKELLLSSSLGVEGQRSDMLVQIGQKLECERYLTPPGSLDYLAEEHPIFSKANIAVVVQQFQHPEYSQLFPPFAPYAAALDLAMNCSTESCRQLLHAGSRPPLALPEALRASSSAGI